MKVICVTGTPACGKSRLSKPLAKRLGYQHLELTPFLVKHGLSEVYNKRMQTYDVVIPRLRRFLEPLLEKAHDHHAGIVIDGHLSHELSPRLVDVVVVVRCDPKVLHRRLLLRKYSPVKVQENMDAEIFGVCEEEARAYGHKVVVVDGTSFKQHAFKAMMQKILHAVGVR